jgi:Domain of unknown function (DUF4410)
MCVSFFNMNFSSKIKPLILVKVILLIAGIVGVIGLGGCASVSVTNMQERPVAAPLLLPELIYVEKFQAADEILRVDRTGTELVEFKKELQSRLATETVERLTKHLALAHVLDTGSRPSKGWLVRGRFVRVNQGSRALRLLIGVGLGGTKMETEVEVIDLASSSQPFLTFRTTGGSNAEPGAITGAASTGPIDAAVGTVLGVALVASHGVSEDAKKTAYEITASLSEYAGKRGWLSDRKTLEYKRLGADEEKAKAEPQGSSRSTGSSQNSKR